MNLFYQPLIADGIRTLNAEESKHAVRVMRRRVGDIIHITDGKGTHYIARITSEDQNKCAFEITDAQRAEEPGYRIHIAISPLSHPDRLEWFVEKAVEIGVDTITLISCERTEKRQPKLERLQKIAIGAMKQSQRFTLPEVIGPLAFNTFIESCSATQKFIAFVDTSNPLHLYTQAKAGHSSVICIGPEGDFTESELQNALAHNFEKVSLGAYRLRAETAGLTACHLLNLVNLS